MFLFVEMEKVYLPENWELIGAQVPAVVQLPVVVGCCNSFLWSCQNVREHRESNTRFEECFSSASVANAGCLCGLVVKRDELLGLRVLGSVSINSLGCFPNFLCEPQKLAYPCIHWSAVVLSVHICVELMSSILSSLRMNFLRRAWIIAACISN